MPNNIIVMNRGDSYRFNINVYDYSNNCGYYMLQGNDVVYLGIMDPHQPFEDALVKKRYTVNDVDCSGLLIASIEPEDTLDLLPGKYYYAVKLKMDHYDDDNNRIEKVITIIDKTKFIICD